MFKTLSVLALTLLLGISAANAMTPKEAAVILQQSVFAVTNNTSVDCTSSKIGPGIYLTAGHCSSVVRSGTTINDVPVRSILKPVARKDNGKDHDWAILNMAIALNAVPSLTLGCNEELYLGMPIAYGGFPDPLNFTFGTGFLASLSGVNNSGSDSDFIIDVQAAPGASGSPVISLDTGDVIGVLIEGVYNARAGFFLVGVQSMVGPDLCGAK